VFRTDGANVARTAERLKADAISRLPVGITAATSFWGRWAGATCRAWSRSVTDRVAAMVRVGQLKADDATAA
jgi:hypothetical protein